MQPISNYVSYDRLTPSPICPIYILDLPIVLRKGK